MQKDLPQADSSPSILLDKVHELTSPEKVETLANKMLGFEQAECSVKHHVGAGIYIRELIVPAGTFIIGHHHKSAHMNVMLKGRVINLNEDGTTSEMQAGAVYKCEGGRKVGLVLEDMVWQNIYPNPDNETDFDVLENRFVSKAESWDDHVKAQNSLEYICRHTDREDYKKLVGEVGENFNIDSDCKFFPEGSYSIKISDSNIEGKGVFALSPIKSGEVIAPTFTEGKVTPAGRYINHAIKPNAKIVLLDNGDINLISIKAIRGCHGGDSGEEITINYRQTIPLAHHIRSSLCQ